jgi:hypothetical protein
VGLLQDLHTKSSFIPRQEESIKTIRMKTFREVEYICNSLNIFALVINRI